MMSVSILKQITKWSVIIVIVLTLFVVIALHSISSRLRGDADSISTLFDEYNYEYVVNLDTIDGSAIRSITTGKLNSTKTILFFHGAPGSWKDYSDYLIDKDLQRASKMIVIDRPGYGYSDYGHPETSIIQQAKIARQITSLNSRVSIILVGFSYGGPVATAYAGLYPEQVSSILLMAPVLAPGHEKIFWFNKPLSWPPISVLMPKYIKVANAEKLSHQSALEQITLLYQHISALTIHLHCLDDWVAPYEPNVNWASKNISNYRLIDWEGDGHFLPNSKIDIVKPELLKLVSTDILPMH
jgi:pimeloyl-ACP methyl ester carboxylesterase